MLRTLKGILRDRTMRSKLLFVAGVLALYRAGAWVPTPGVNSGALAHAQGASSLALLNMFSGGDASRMGIFALGVMPFITASIMMQVLGAVLPKLSELRREGPVGEARITQYTRYATLAVALLQSFAIVFLLKAVTSGSRVPVLAAPSARSLLLVVCCLTGGAMLLMWFGEFITRRNVGQGVSLLLLGAIISRLPHGLAQWWTMPDATLKVALPFVFAAMVGAVVFMQEGVRRIPVQYAKRMIGARMSSGRSHLPLRVNTANVVPVIFASTLLAFPPTIGSLVHAHWAASVSSWLSPPHWQWMACEFVLILAFSYFYTAMMVNPAEQAENLEKSGGFIPGVHPGQSTASYISRVSRRLTLPGALYLSVLAVLPALLFAHAGFALGGTTVIIVVGVALDTVRRVRAEFRVNDYDKFV